jgi:hypothetical protein
LSMREKSGETRENVELTFGHFVLILIQLFLGS